MPRIDTLPKVIPSLGQKAIGLTREFWGTVLDIDNLRERGKAEQDEADHRLEEFRREVKANVSRAKAVAKEQRQRTLQDKPASGSPADADKSGPRSAASAAAEKVKGGVKEATGSVVGNDRLRREGAVQQEKASAEADVAREEAGAEEARLKAEQARARAEAARRA